MSKNICLAVLCAAVIAVAGCIPTETPAPKAEPKPLAGPGAADTGTKPETKPVDTVSQTTPEGAVRSTLKVDPTAKPNTSVKVTPRAEGGFDVEGTFNLRAVLAPETPGKWRLKGEFSMRETDLAVGEPMVAPVQDVTLGGGMQAVSGDGTSFMIVIPVRPPAAQAPETDPVRPLPLDFAFDAPEGAHFNITYAQMPQ